MARTPEAMATMAFVAICRLLSIDLDAPDMDLDARDVIGSFFSKTYFSLFIHGDGKHPGPKQGPIMAENKKSITWTAAAANSTLCGISCRERRPMDLTITDIDSLRMLLLVREEKGQKPSHALT